MTRTLMPTPDDPGPAVRAVLPDAQPDAEAQAVLDLLRSESAVVPAQPASAQPVPSPPERSEPPAAAVAPTGQDNLTLPLLATGCYANVPHDVASARVVRRIVAMFGEADCAESCARGDGYHLRAVVPATAASPTSP